MTVIQLIFMILVIIFAKISIKKSSVQRKRHYRIALGIKLEIIIQVKIHLKEWQAKEMWIIFYQSTVN